jgi:hypothetical protein
MEDRFAVIAAVDHVLHVTIGRDAGVSRHTDPFGNGRAA